MRKCLPLLMLASLLLAGGCEDGPDLPRVPFTSEGSYLPGPAGSGAVASPDSPIPDVPMPVGFRPVASKSSSSMEGQARVVRHVYQGRSEPTDVVLMYRQHLPRQNWSYLGRESDDDGATVLRYTKGPEALRVRVVERGTLSTVTTVQIDITPRGGAPAGDGGGNNGASAQPQP